MNKLLALTGNILMIGMFFGMLFLVSGSSGLMSVRVTDTNVLPASTVRQSSEVIQTTQSRETSSVQAIAGNR